ncbi:MAG: hypothetical protein N4A50_15375 [Vallitalea sp.]|nr:hypothetical protein [Vallitalea sp.]
MNHTQIVIYFITLLVVGLSLSANNFVHSLIVNVFFYNDSLSKNFTRILGLMLILSSILLIIGAYNLCIVLIFVVLITLIFLIIRGKNKSKGIKEKKKQELINNHLSEVATKMKKIEHLREKLDTSQNTSHKSIKNIQKSRWNDGSPTQKEIIEGFNK